MHDGGSAVPGRKLSSGNFQSALHSRWMFDRLDVDGGSREQAAREHRDESAICRIVHQLEFILRQALNAENSQPRLLRLLCQFRETNETSDCPHPSEIFAQPADQTCACGESAAARIYVARNQRTEDGEATAHASGRWTYRKSVLVSSGAWHEGGIRPQH